MAGLMSLGTRAMNASYVQLQTTGNNISNANVAGYSRQEVQVETSNGMFTGAGFFGKGVDVTTITRSYNEFLVKEAASARATANADATRLEQLKQLEKVFPIGENGIGYSATQFLNAMSDVANRPQDMASRQVALTRATDLAARISTASNQLDALQAGTVQDVKNSVATVNEMARQIAAVNQQIASTKGLGHDPNDLLDKRDQLIADLSGYIQISTIGADDGTISIFVAGGQSLVLGNSANQLSATQDLFDPARVRLNLVDASGTRQLHTSSLGAGSLYGLMSFQDSDLVAARNMLGQMTYALVDAVNNQQALGIDLAGNAGSDIFTVGAPRALPATTNGKDALGNYLTSVTMTVTDSKQLQASDYALRAGTVAGTYTLTRLSDGLVRTISSGDVVDGVRIDVGPPAPSATDRFLLQPVGTAASQVRRVLDDPRGIAAASPVEATANVNNTGTATVASLHAVSTTIDPTLTATVTFTSNTGNYSWQLVNAANVVVSSGTATWTAGTPISLNGFELDLNGVPQNGDIFTVRRTQFPAANNGNALAMVDLRDAKIANGNTFTDAYANTMANIGVRVQSTRLAADISSASVSAAEAARANQSGVNLDEEAARLIQFQQTYQAAAKILQVAQSLFDTVLSMTGR